MSVSCSTSRAFRALGEPPADQAGAHALNPHFPARYARVPSFCMARTRPGFRRSRLRGAVVGTVRAIPAGS